MLLVGIDFTKKKQERGDIWVFPLNYYYFYINKKTDNRSLKGGFFLQITHIRSF